MAGYSTRNEKVLIGGHVYRLRVLSDKEQFSDPDGYRVRLGISPAQWSQFGQVWPSGRLLAQAMHRYRIANKRILELGCGIGLASLVLQRRGADITASDMHPLAGLSWLTTPCSTPYQPSITIACAGMFPNPRLDISS